jgi:hypothetical protein
MPCSSQAAQDKQKEEAGCPSGSQTCQVVLSKWRCSTLLTISWWMHLWRMKGGEESILMKALSDRLVEYFNVEM